ncbi:MAG: hypothetical protein JNL21_41725 [Myxococcales bacterium]|nr:hypothetical protein [Myxococcales bacterium]
MGVHLALLESTWSDQAPQPGGTPLDSPVLRAWKCTLGAALVLRSVEGGDDFAAWLEQIIESGGGEHLLTLDPIDVGELHAVWTADLLPKLTALVGVARAHDFTGSFGVRSAAELEAVLLAWATCIAHALSRGRGLIGMRT